ncbi:MAG: hypothetical protein KDB24_08680 [Microthrixaceae bacterium]|nr:hypothetical protein [Microthrixaceae bacterium]
MTNPGPPHPTSPSRLRWVRALVTVGAVVAAALLIGPRLGSSEHRVGPGSVSIGF